MLFIFIFSRMPISGKLRIQWMNRILRHQKYEFSTSDFFVCEMHFLEENFKEMEPVKALKYGTVPSIFPETPSELPNIDEIVFMETEQTDNDLPNFPSEFGKSSRTKVCKICIKQHIELMKAKSKLNLFEKNQQKLRDTLVKLKKELIILRKKMKPINRKGKICAMYDEYIKLIDFLYIFHIHEHSEQHSTIKKIN